MTELELMEMELRVQKLEKDQSNDKEIMQIVVSAINELKAFRNQFKNANGFVPKIIEGVTSKFEKMFKDFKDERNKKLQNHVDEIKTIIALIPCSKLLGDGCTYKLIAKEDKAPEGWKEFTPSGK